jgi:peptidoglycan/LPS O-acetylase OafA/YrhL
VQLPTVFGYGLFAGNLMQLTRYGSSVLSPLWSLAVEEHFYLLWPIVVLLSSRRTLFVVLSAVLIAEPIIRAIASPHFASFETIYSLTPFRLYGLAAGSLLALLTEGGVTWPWQRWCGWIALAISPFFLLYSLANRNANSVGYNALSYTFFAVNYFCVVA